jgi:hypothetical protein
LVVVVELPTIGHLHTHHLTVDLVVVEVEIRLLVKVMLKIIQDHLNKVIQVVLVEVVMMTVVAVVALVLLVRTLQHLDQVLVV